MSIETPEEGMAATCLLFDDEIKAEISSILKAMSFSNTYYTALFEISSYINDKRTHRLYRAIECVETAILSKENKSALYLIIINLLKKYEKSMPEKQIFNKINDLYIDWSKTKRNILTCVQVVAEDDWKALINERTK
jgi:hypothetical protein